MKEKEKNKKNINNLSGKEIKTGIRMLTKLGERTDEHRENLRKESENIKKNKTGNSLVVPEVGLSTFTARTRVQSLSGN